MSEEVKKTNEDDTLRTGTSFEWRGDDSPSGPAPEEEEEDIPRGAHHTETRSAGQKEST
jgi:hypothetical protein